MGSTLCQAPRCRDHRAGGPQLAVGGSQLCSVCRARLADDLAELPESHRATDHVLDNRRALMRERVSGGTYSGIDLNIAAVEARHTTVAVLASWSGLVAAEREVAAPELREVGAMAKFLTRHLDWLASHPALPDFADEIEAAARSTRAAAYPGTRSVVDIGPCTVPECESTVRATIGQGEEPRANAVSCADGHSVPPHQWLLLGQRLAQAKAGGGETARPTPRTAGPCRGQSSASPEFRPDERKAGLPAAGPERNPGPK